MKVNQPSDPSAIVIPFGKHKGSTVAELLAKDEAYAQWVLTQGWVAERFAELHAALLTRGAGTDDTPEHNALQARFLDGVFRSSFVRIILGTSEEYHTSVQFEHRGVDVVICWGEGYYDFESKERWENRNRSRIELKPTLGDDYPTTLRQMQRLKCDALLIGQYTGRGVSETQLRQIFEMSRFHILFVQEIDEHIRRLS